MPHPLKDVLNLEYHYSGVNLIPTLKFQITKLFITCDMRAFGLYVNYVFICKQELLWAELIVTYVVN